MYEQPFVRREPVMLNLAELGSGQNVKRGAVVDGAHPTPELQSLNG